MPGNKCPWASDKWHTPFLLSQPWGRGSELWWPQLVLSPALRPLSCISCKQGTVPPQRWPGNELARADAQLHHTQHPTVPEGTMGQPIIHNILLKAALPFRDSFEHINHITCQPSQSFYFQLIISFTGTPELLYPAEVSLKILFMLLFSFFPLLNHSSVDLHHPTIPIWGNILLCWVLAMQRRWV